MLTLLRPVLTLLNPVEVEVDRLVTLLLVVLRPVLRLETPVLTDETPVLTLLSARAYRREAGADAAQARGDDCSMPVEVEVDRLVTLLFVVLRPVLRLQTPVLILLDPRAQRRDARAHG